MASRRSKMSVPYDRLRTMTSSNSVEAPSPVAVPSVIAAERASPQTDPDEDPRQDQPGHGGYECWQPAAHDRRKCSRTGLHPVHERHDPDERDREAERQDVRQVGQGEQGEEGGRRAEGPSRLPTDHEAGDHDKSDEAVAEGVEPVVEDEREREWERGEREPPASLVDPADRVHDRERETGHEPADDDLLGELRADDPGEEPHRHVRDQVGERRQVQDRVLLDDATTANQRVP